MSYVTITFPGDPKFVSEARKWTALALGRELPGVDSVVLIASELASNALQHTASGEPGGTFTLHLATFSDRWQVRVDDGGGSSVPNASPGMEDDEGGRGLAVVSELSNSWGVLGDQYSRSVWAEIAFPCQEPSYG